MTGVRVPCVIVLAGRYQAGAAHRLAGRRMGGTRLPGVQGGTEGDEAAAPGRRATPVEVGIRARPGGTATNRLDPARSCAVHGPWNMGRAMSSLPELAVLFPNEPYFLGNTMGVMGEPLRHLYMAAAVATLQDLDRAVRVLEIGSWIGFSTLTWAQALDERVPHKGSILCVDPWASYWSPAEIQAGGVMATMDFMARSDLSYNLFRHNLTFAPPGVRIDHVRGRSEDVLPYFADGAFDLVFIDGDHRYAAVANELREADRLLADGGLLCGDDLEHQAPASACAALDPAIHYRQDPATGVRYHPGVTRAVAEALGPVSAYEGFFVMRKLGGGYVPVDLSGRTASIPRHFPPALKASIRSRFG